jgi:hypothetical protein
MERATEPGVAAEPAATDPRAGVLAELDSPSPVLAIAFGGMLMRVDGMPPFEFLRVLSDAAPTKRLFLRDHSQAYYHRGVRGLGEDIAGVETGLREVVAETQPSRVVMMGGSGGGYAALLFGRLLGVDEVHAFAPTTFLRADLRARCGDDRFQERWNALMASGCYQPRYGDLRELFQETPDCGTRFVVHYPADYDVDVFHAEWIAPEPGVVLRPHDATDHRVVRHLREAGELQQLLRNALVG